MIRFFVLLLIFFSLPVAASQQTCKKWPKGMVFVGLTNGGWQTYAVIKEGKKPKKLKMNAEVRTPVLSSKDNNLFYIDDSARVNVFSFKGKKLTTLLSPTKNASYAQPEINEKNNVLYVVQLKQGKSVDTDILQFDLTNQKATPIIIQRSAQFEPKLSTPWLYYSNVHCVLGCGNIIQEIWRYHTVSGIAEQITLLNNISRQPVADEQNQWLYFSSNAAGNYHIYRQSLMQKNMPTEQLTTGAVTDMSPAIVDGRLYFIRQQADIAELMCRTENGQLHTLPLPKGVTQLRDLEI